MKCSFLLRFTVASTLLFFAMIGIGNAALFRAYLSISGDDTNACTLTAPCRLLPAALTAVADGGEIWMLDSANYNTDQVEIHKSVTILAIPGVFGSVVATNGHDAIYIPDVGLKVTLRNLLLVSLGGSNNGITFVQGQKLIVEDCEIANIAGQGIYVTAGNVAVKNTVLRGMGNAGFLAGGTAVAVLDGVHAKDNDVGVNATGTSSVSVSNSVLTANNVGAFARPYGGGKAKLVITDSVFNGNSGGIVASPLNASVAEIVASRNVITNSFVDGIAAYQPTFSTVSVLSDGNTLTENTVAFHFAQGSPTIYTRSNNTVKLNGTAVVGGALLPLASM
jgi:hypothetical protein